jgi:cardiolipin synthase
MFSVKHAVCNVHVPYDVNSGMWTIPNLFTLLRVAMTPYILLELARGEYMIAGWVFGAAAFTDTLDGFIARRFHAQSRVGLYLDPIADKLLLSSIYIGLMLGHAIPAWLVAVVSRSSANCSQACGARRARLRRS